MKLKENAILVYNFVKEHETENITHKDIAAATGLTDRQVTGIVTMAFCRHRDKDKNEIHLMERVAGEVELEDGTHKTVKFIKLTEAGRNIEVEEAE